jgi:glycosidase
MAPLYQAIDSQFDFNSYYHNTEYVYLHTADGPYSTTNAGVLGLATANKFNTYFKQYRSDFINSAFTSNHDVLRAINQINATKNGSEYVVPTISGSKDQIEKAKIHAAITMLQPGLSFIYYGDELGMSSNTSENALSHSNHIDRYYRQPMKWANENERPFITISKGIDNSYDSYNLTLKNVDEQNSDPNSMLNFYKNICKIKARADFPKNGLYTAVADNNQPSVLNYTISGNEGKIKVVIHTAGNNKNTYKYQKASNEEVIYSYNANESTINAYGILVLKVK